MAWIMACPGCTQGDHSKHVRGWNIQPGLIGGAWCDCPGEPTCSERFKAFAERLLHQMGLATPPTRSRRYDQCDGTCTVDCGHCKGQGPPAAGLSDTDTPTEEQS